MKKLYDLYETYASLHVDGSDIDTLRADLVLHFNFISEYSQPINYSHEDGTFNVKKFLKTFVGTAYQPCLGLGDVPETFYRFFVNYYDEIIIISGTSNEHEIPFSALDIESSSTKPIAQRSTYTEEF